MAVDEHRRSVLDPDRVFNDVERWGAETASTTPGVQAGSALDQDAQLSPKWQVAHMAWGCYVSAVDNLAALRALMTQEIRPYAPYSLLRVAIENAATMVWLLQPDESSERVTRRLRLVWDESNDLRSLEAVAPGMFREKSGADARRAEVQAIADAAGLPRERVCGRWSWATLVTAAGASTGLQPSTVELMWRLCSGFAHARDWARWSWLDVEQVGAKDGDIVTTRTTTSVDRIMMMSLGAHELVKAGRGLYDGRRLAWKLH